MTLDDAITHIEQQHADLGVALKVLRALAALPADTPVAPKLLPAPPAPGKARPGSVRRPKKPQSVPRAEAATLWKQGKTVKAIAQALDLPYSTVYGWSKKDDWPVQATAVAAKGKTPTPAPAESAEGLTARQAKAQRLLAEGRSYASVAEAIGVTPEKIGRWVEQHGWVTMRSPTPVPCPRCRKATHVQPCEWCQESSWDLESALRSAAAQAA